MIEGDSGGTSLADVGYRILGGLVQARYQIALVVGVLNAVFLLLELSLVLEDPSWLDVVGLLDTPILLAIAVWLVARLPPGIVFRDGAARTAADGPPPGSCWVSGQFQVGNHSVWRVLVPSSLGLVEWGGIRVRAPGYAVRARRPIAPPFTVGQLDWSRPVARRQPTWAADPLLLHRQIRAHREPRQLVDTPAHLAISSRQIQDVSAGWQYVGLRRYPALRITHRGADRGEQFTYLAFDTPADRDAVRARLS